MIKSPMLVALLFCFISLHLTEGYVARARSSMTSKPCLARFLMVKQYMKLYGEIREGPHYVPECENDGYLWKEAQCEYPNTGTCFCVDRETGNRLPHTTRHDVIREFMDCQGGEYALEIKSCEDRVQRYKKIQELIGINHVMDYFPVCSGNGSFMAMQRNDRFFFCVDTTTGEKIPGTQSERELPITEQICNSFSNLWKGFKDSMLFGTAEEVYGPQSCRTGTIYEECGCRVLCTPGEDMLLTSHECAGECRPVCKCPEGSFELNGQCVSNEECMAADAFINKKQQIQSWAKFMDENADELIQYFFKLIQGEMRHSNSNIKQPETIDYGARTEVEYSGVDGAAGVPEYNFYENHLAYEELDDEVFGRVVPEEVTEYYEDVVYDASDEYPVFEMERHRGNGADDDVFVRIASMQYKKSSQQG